MVRLTLLEGGTRCILSGDGTAVGQGGPVPRMNPGTSGVSDDAFHLADRDIICLGYGPWAGLHGYLHHVMARFAARNRVLYVEGAPPTARGRRWLPASVGTGLRALTAFFRGLERIDERLYVLHPWTSKRGASAPDCLDRHLLIDRVRFQQRHLGLSDPILWCAFPTGAHLAGRLDESLLVYQCLDDYGCVPGVRREAIRDLEDRLLERADLVLAASGHLFRGVMHEHPNAYYMPVAAEVDHFARVGPEGTAIPADLDVFDRPRVGFVGAVCANKVDLELLADLARARPDWSVCVIGPAPDRSRTVCRLVLGEIGNVHFLGRKPYADLPAYYAGLDAVVLPYRLNEHTRAVFPPQFIEALAAGKPMVITELDAIEHYRLSPTLCHVARGRREFIRMAEAAVAEQPTDAALDLRRGHARRYDLDDRMADIETLLHHALARRSRGSAASQTGALVGS